MADLPRALVLERDEKRRVAEAVREYVATEHEWELGGLEAEFLVDLLIRELGPTLYNRGIRDAHDWLATRVADLEVDLWLAEPGTRRG